MFNTVLIANRGAIATRIIRTLKTLGIRSIAVYNQADAQSLHVQHADIAVCLGEGSPANTYLNSEKIINVAKTHGAQAVHPGYGFLSENTEFVKRCEQENIAFIGPTAKQITAFGLKHEARDLAEKANVALVPGSPLLSDINIAIKWADKTSYPIMLKSTAGGGGIGMQICHNQSELENAWDSVKRLSENYFANDGVFLEKFIANARHIEVQIFGDGKGKTVSLGERDCSAQRRNQKVIEETPAPNLSESLRHQLHQTAERLMTSVNYRNAGTVEFIFDTDEDKFYFLEVNTRLQVEHGVTEEVWGVDLVAWMIKLAANELGDIQELKRSLTPFGHAIQARVYAEDPNKNFLPSSGLVSHVEWPDASKLRIDHWIETGIEISTLFDPMLAKVIVNADDRQQAIDKLHHYLSDSQLYGIETNIDYVRSILEDDACKKGQLLTRSLAEFHFIANTIEVLQAGTQTSIQDYPGRTDLWHVGVPPSGPMDSLNFRLANRLLKNNCDAAALEITVNGPSLRFNSDCHIALTGADIEAELSGQSVAMYTSIKATAGQILKLGKITNHGARSYLAVSGGLQCPSYLGSKATFTLGQFGGHVGRALRVGDVLHLSENKLDVQLAIESSQQPKITNEWQLRVIYGPHGAPEFFTEEDINIFFSHQWEVHYNSSRTGVRLIGPKPTWARETGGEAGLHPSNIHDNAYAFGTVDFTGDMPVILGPDGPSLGGFVCPATVIQADLWKLGQLKAGDKIQFVAVNHVHAVALESQQQINIEQLINIDLDIDVVPYEYHALPSPIIHRSSIADDEVVYRLAGDHFLLVEIGPLELNISRRFNVHALMLWLEDNPLAGVKELTPGIRSLQIHYDSQQLSLDELINHIENACRAIEHNDDLSVPARIVHLPLSWDDEACTEAINKYMQSVRPDAPWCPSNLEFIRRINGLKDIAAVKDIVFNASYLVMGLGDVYLGAPVATPLDPRHRLVTTKYNPARTWTAENSVGIGGAYLCVYGMEGPGGYQFVGRTLQMWNRYRQTKEFDKPWLLRFFDQIRFYEVSAEELKQIRADFPLGKYPIKIEETHFSLNEYEVFLSENSDGINAFQQQRQQAFEEELEQWCLNGQMTYEQEEFIETDTEGDDLPEDVMSIDSHLSGSVWQILVEEGNIVKAGDTLIILESMKMEIAIQAEHDGKIRKILKKQGQPVTTGQSLIWLET